MPYEVTKGSLSDFTGKSDNVVGYFATEAQAQAYANAMNESLHGDDAYKYLFLAGQTPRPDAGMKSEGQLASVKDARPGDKPGTSNPKGDGTSTSKPKGDGAGASKPGGSSEAKAKTAPQGGAGEKAGKDAKSAGQGEGKGKAAFDVAKAANDGLAGGLKKRTDGSANALKGFERTAKARIDDAVRDGRMSPREGLRARKTIEDYVEKNLQKAERAERLTKGLERLGWAIDAIEAGKNVYDAAPGKRIEAGVAEAVGLAAGKFFGRLATVGVAALGASVTGGGRGRARGGDRDRGRRRRR